MNNFTQFFENDFSNLFNTSSVEFDDKTFLIAFACASAGVALISELMACSSCKAKGIVFFLIELVKTKSNCAKAIANVQQQQRSSKQQSAIDNL